MHRLKFFFPTLLLLLAVATGCSDKTVQVFTANQPVYQDLTTWRATTFALAAPTALQRPGKIYIYNDLLIVNELLKGVHIYDNANPNAPVDLGFLPVHANMDIAVRNNVMYLDSYTDLLSFDISNPRQPSFLTRINDVFTFDRFYQLPGFDENLPLVAHDPTKGVIMSWIQGETTVDLYRYSGPMEDMLTSFSGGGNPTGSTLQGGSGTGGSTARFTIHDHYLYTLESWQLGVFDIADGMVHTSDVGLFQNSETLFPQDGYLYIGTTTGMSIYSLSNPTNPTFVSSYSHVTSCDPVAVQGDKAFVTLSTGRTCQGTVNSLMVIDLSNIATPTLMYEFPMTNPKGLGLDGNTLFLCDGADGLKIFDKTDLSAIPNNLISQFGNIFSADVIPHNQVLIMTSAEGIYQYSYADLNNIVQLSQIPVVH